MTGHNRAPIQISESDEALIFTLVRLRIQAALASPSVCDPHDEAEAFISDLKQVKLIEVLEMNVDLKAPKPIDQIADMMNRKNEAMCLECSSIYDRDGYCLCTTQGVF